MILSTALVKILRRFFSTPDTYDLDAFRNPHPEYRALPASHPTTHIQHYVLGLQLTAAIPPHDFTVVVKSIELRKQKGRASQHEYLAMQTCPGPHNSTGWVVFDRLPDPTRPKDVLPVSESSTDLIPSDTTSCESLPKPRVANDIVEFLPDGKWGLNWQDKVIARIDFSQTTTSKVLLCELALLALTVNKDREHLDENCHYFSGTLFRLIEKKYVIPLTLDDPKRSHRTKKGIQGIPYFNKLPDNSFAELLDNYEVIRSDFWKYVHSKRDETFQKAHQINEDAYAVFQEAQRIKQAAEAELQDAKRFYQEAIAERQDAERLKQEVERRLLEVMNKPRVERIILEAEMREEMMNKRG